MQFKTSTTYQPLHSTYAIVFIGLKTHFTTSTGDHIPLYIPNFHLLARFSTNLGGKNLPVALVYTVVSHDMTTDAPPVTPPKNLMTTYSNVLTQTANDGDHLL